MPRRARRVRPNVPLHLIQRGNNRQAYFFADEDYRLYLDWLGEYADKTGCRVHAYVLMTNHVHFSWSPRTKLDRQDPDEGARPAVCAVCESRLSP